MKRPEAKSGEALASLVTLSPMPLMQPNDCKSIYKPSFQAAYILLLRVHNKKNYYELLLLAKVILPFA